MLLILDELGMGDDMRLGAACVLVGFVAGCTSFESTFINRDEYGNVSTTVTPGVPIVVNVPQKIGFVVTETRYLVEFPITNKEGKKTGIARRTVTETSVDKTPISLSAGQLVSLDIKRPMAGTADNQMTLVNQYPQSVHGNVNDQTFDKVLAAFDKLTALQKKPGLAATGDEEALPEGAKKTPIGQRTYMIVYDPAKQTLTRMRL
jgi:hypothetical protein